MITTMKRHRRTPEQAVHKVREGEHLLNESKELAEVLRHLGLAQLTGNRRRATHGESRARRSAG
jgi:hypothetical protein